MDKTKIMLLAATLAVLAVTSIVGAVYAQSVSNQTVVHAQSSYSQNPQNPSFPGTYNGYGFGDFTCPRVSRSNTYGTTQSSYSYEMGMRGGMMGGYYR